MKSQTPRSRLARQVLLLFLGVFAFQLGLMLLSFLSFYKAQEQNSVQTNALLLQQANDNYLTSIVTQIDRGILQAYYDKLFWTDASTGGSDRISDYYKLLASTYRMNDNIQSVYLYASQDDRLYLMDEVSYANLPIYSEGSNSFYQSGPEMESAPWYHAAKIQNGSLAVTEMEGHRRSASREAPRLLSFSRALSDPLRPSELRYVISVNVELSFFQRLARQVCKPGEGLAVLTQDSTMVFCGMFGDALLPEDAVQSALAAEDPQQGIRIEGQSYLLLTNRARDTGWQMVKVIPRASLVAEAQRTLWMNLSGTALIFLLSGLLLLFIIRRVVRPVNELTEVMENYEVRKDILPAYAGRRDEIGRLFGSFVTMRDHIDRLITQEYAAQIREKQARIEALQAQVNPHFLNNTLQTIAGIAVDRDIPEIERMVSALSAILRYSLTKSRKLVPLREEIHIVKQYMYIQKHRYGDRIHLENDLSPESLNCLIPVLTLQLAVENAVRHGLETKLGRGLIRIYDESRESGVLLLVIEDNGTGVSEERLAELRQSLHSHTTYGQGWNGNGLINMNERIRSFWGQGYGITLESRPEGGLLVRMRLPQTFQQEGNDHDESAVD